MWYLLDRLVLVAMYYVERIKKCNPHIESSMILSFPKQILNPYYLFQVIKISPQVLEMLIAKIQYMAKSVAGIS